jgi:hypothetical protein
MKSQGDFSSNGISSVQFTLTATPSQTGSEGSIGSYPLPPDLQGEVTQGQSTPRWASNEALQWEQV